ncbi:unnamed protein product [Gongylonema pulchrum]|uniref:C2H2-type domain-containing protein n=1 Tax=Gongylonema pulchrum TaxID=637853 RepID=A0A183DRP6_9BILA|nr:unnamed protein product [Gongylonema pulchrum]
MLVGRHDRQTNKRDYRRVRRNLQVTEHRLITSEKPELKAGESAVEVLIRMMQPPPPPHRTSSGSVQNNVMRRMVLPAQVSNMVDGNGRAAEQSRDDLPFIGRSFPPSGFQMPQQQQQQHHHISGEMVDMWPNASPGHVAPDGFHMPFNGNVYGYAHTAYPNMLNLPQLPPIYLRCPECGLVKMNSEEMEIHLKVEHLQWLPYQCTMCSAERAADFQLREHIISVHRKNTDKFIYVDNPGAKRMYRILMDRCLMNARRLVGSSHPAQQFQNPSPIDQMRETLVNHHANDLDGRKKTVDLTATESLGENSIQNITALANGSGARESPQEEPKSANATAGAAATATASETTTRRISVEILQIKMMPFTAFSASENSSVPWNTNTGAVLSAIRVATQENEEVEREEVEDESEGSEDSEVYDEEFNAGARSATESSSFDPAPRIAESSGAVEQSDEALSATEVATEGDHDTTEILGNVAAIFSADDVGIRRRRKRRARGERPKLSASSLAKKRVLGECSRCKKPVTAGARQMHMFFHLGKDCKVFRFRCTYPGCTVEHYRKDQMENHQSKVHGKINSLLIEDRTAALFDACQELSMQLLGTTGNMPGPTAAKAQKAYEAILAAQALRSIQKKKASEKVLALRFFFLYSVVFLF